MLNRCSLCALPMEPVGQTPYCSERCLLWDTFGVPALKEDDLIAEMLRNQRRRKGPEDWTPQPAYPELDEYVAWRENKQLVIDAAALTAQPPEYA